MKRSSVDVDIGLEYSDGTVYLHRVFGQAAFVGHRYEPGSHRVRYRTSARGCLYVSVFVLECYRWLEPSFDQLALSRDDPPPPPDPRRSKTNDTSPHHRLSRVIVTFFLSITTLGELDQGTFSAPLPRHQARTMRPFKALPRVYMQLLAFPCSPAARPSDRDSERPRSR